ncbi:hypothetical protein ABH920_003517 [Catenulispora sp. EB89]|uniref:hypothetical protein n=1 Tax=Catenulispora sp. EB89 TaxID=3156257 RepID=UPI003510E1C7
MPHRKKTTRVAALVLVLASAALGASACSSSAPAQSAKTTSCTDFATLIAAAISGNNGATDQATTLKNGQALAQSLTQEAAAATDPNAKTAMAAFAADYTSLVAAIGKADAGDKAAAADVTTISAKVTTDSASVKSVCGN